MEQRTPKLPDIERRKPVWLALSEFYLDTELSDQDLLRINNIFVASGYSIEEIRDIERNEVRPAVGVNLFGVAGVWSGFDEQRLYDAILKRIAKRRPTRWQRFWIRDSLTARYWDRLNLL